MNQHVLGSLLAASLLLSPVAAFADGIIQLQPLTHSGYGAQTDYNTTPYNNSNVSLRGRVSSIPKGTMLMIKLDQPVSSFGSRLGDSISATLENDIYINETIAIPAGSQVTGQVANVTSAGHVGKHGEIDVRFNSIKTPDGNLIPIQAHVVTSDETGILKGNTFTQDLLKGVGTAAGGAGVGTLMGTAAGGLLGSVGTGAVVGLSMGALGGMGYALMRKGKDVVIPAQSRMSILVDQPVTTSF